MYYNNRKLILSAFWMVLGAVLIWLTVSERLDSEYFSGMGGALLAVGALQVARNLRYRKDEDYREKIDTEFKDERNGFLRMKSWSWAGYITILAQGVGVVVAQLAGERTISLVLSYSVCFIILVYWVAYLILKRKY